MRRKYFGLAIAAFATLGPMQAWGGDREIAEQIIERLKVNRDSGALKDFTLDMKVDNGVVLFRGSVSEAAHKNLVLQAAEGIEGIAGVRDELTVGSVAAESEPAATPVKLEAAPSEAIRPASDFSLRNALAAQAKRLQQPTLEVMPGEIRPAAAVEIPSDATVVSSVVAALSRAKDTGQLRGFGVDVKSVDGVVRLAGRASSAQQRDAIVRIVERTPGVSSVQDAITVPGDDSSLPHPPVLQEAEAAPLSPVATHGVPARTASTRMGAPTMTAPYRTQNGMGTPATPASMGGHMQGMQMQGAQMQGMQMQGMPVQGQPVPMAPHSAVGAPRYDTPNMPNYAWPGYASHPNYAAVTYPQQYSPSAWPYIGPFYPYPQVPLGWRKVSLEWDDGWWFLDFTDR